MAGRLINTDDIQIKIIYPRMCGKSIVVETVAEVIETILNNAPTVDAIPVEWLKENYPTNGVYGTESYFRKAHAVEDILKDWEREKEKRKEE